MVFRDKRGGGRTRTIHTAGHLFFADTLYGHSFPSNVHHQDVGVDTCWIDMHQLTGLLTCVLHAIDMHPLHLLRLRPPSVAKAFPSLTHFCPNRFGIIFWCPAAATVFWRVGHHQDEAYPL